MKSQVRQYLAGVRDAILLKATAGRSHTVFPDDRYLVSYPKSGNTWVRFLVANLVHSEFPTTFQNVDLRIPEVYNYSDRELRAFPRPRVLKTHEPFDFRYPKVIYIVRDPRDVALSKYHWIRKWRGIPDGYPVEDFVGRWIVAEFDQYLKAGSWADNVLSWLAMRASSVDFLLVRYEDLLGATRDQLRRMARFLGIEPSEEILTRAIDLSSADRMRTLEKKESREWRDTRPTRQDIPFVRKAAAGDWKTACPPGAVRQIEAAWWPLMKLLSYELASSPGSRTPEPLVHKGVCESLADVVRVRLEASREPAKPDAEPVAATKPIGAL
ncbi:MAG TPA: sulfotransferase domain-containing protein [Terriglobia bacterium]|nr:sulfotransferase domain-containing protein [Terriglobia bacterium]